jgi:uncharacterized protein YodC (DUF2158 family)
MFNPLGQDVPSDGAAGLPATSSSQRQLKAGDRVRLMSGGVVMTAEKVRPNVPMPYALCRWMDARDKIQHAFISFEALQLVDAEGQTSSTP